MAGALATTIRCESAARRLAVALAFALAALLAPTTAHAQIAGWSLRLGGIGSNYEKHGGISYGFQASHLDWGSGVGPQGAVELHLDRRLGIELSAAQLDLDAHYRVTQQYAISLHPLILGEQVVHEADGKYTLKPLAAALLFHLFPDRKVDVYFGPQAARVSFANDVGAWPRKPEKGYGGKLGVELRFGDGPWAADVEIGRLEIQHVSTDHDLYGNLGLSTASVLLVFRSR
ncbi:MAG TPA: outer membrane beta-barrel protein [Thermoanaerobaculia bacterium]|jgi:hypothetical protein|nr:outer membrane beta-barrel protein [Thermoanaerobaculia bacterium]